MLEVDPLGEDTLDVVHVRHPAPETMAKDRDNTVMDDEHCLHSRATHVVEQTAGRVVKLVPMRNDLACIGRMPGARGVIESPLHEG